MSQLFMIGDAHYAPDSDDFQNALAHAHKHRLRPLCVCREPPAAMYVAKIMGTYYCKRMPGSAFDHASSCPSFEAPAELSGIGAFKGAAIQEDEGKGVTNLTLDFPFKTGGRRLAPEPSGIPSDTLKANKSKLSLMSLLHYLWDEAGLTTWRPSHSATKQNWAEVRGLLALACDGKIAKGEPLGQKVFLAEPFDRNRVDDYNFRQREQLARVLPRVPGKPIPAAIVIGEVYAVAPSEKVFGTYHVHLVNMRNKPIEITQEFYESYLKKYQAIQDLGKSLGPSGRFNRLIMIGLFSTHGDLRLNLLQGAFMPVDANWLPITDSDEARLTDHLVRSRREFRKNLTYAATEASPAPAVVLFDTPGQATVVFIKAPEASIAFVNAIDEAMKRMEQHYRCVAWDGSPLGLGLLPKPARSRRELLSYRIPLLEVGPDSSGVHDVVVLGEPYSVVRNKERVMFASPRHVLGRIRMSRAEALELGRPSDIQSPKDGFIYRRLSAEEYDRIRRSHAVRDGGATAQEVLDHDAHVSEYRKYRAEAVTSPAEREVAHAPPEPVQAK